LVVGLVVIFQHVQKNPKLYHIEKHILVNIL
jgi:hypothetical protein